MEDYTLQDSSYIPNENETQLLAEFPPVKSKDWESDRYATYKTNLKRHTLKKQFDKCAYCRRTIETDGYYEPLEHIVAKTAKPEWLLHVKNLIVTCNTCNNLKNDEQTLIDNYLNQDNYPTESEAFKIFHPHFDQWSDHLNFDDEIFLIAVPGSKGQETIKVCKLFRYHVIVNRIKELRNGQQPNAKKIIHRLKSMNINSEEAKEMLSAIDHLLERMEDQIGFQAS